MLSRSLVGTLLTVVLALPTGQGRAEEVVKVGIVMPMTGAFAAAGRQVLAGIRLFTQQHGVAGGREFVPDAFTNYFALELGKGQ